LGSVPCSPSRVPPGNRFIAKIQALQTALAKFISCLEKIRHDEAARPHGYAVAIERRASLLPD
jgi:hypothetical protein